MSRFYDNKCAMLSRNCFTCNFSGVLGWCEVFGAGSSMRRFLAIVTVIWFTVGLARAEQPVELELVLLADASSSIQEGEFDLQIGGYARAFRDPGVISAIQELGGNGIAVTFVQWSATHQQFDIVPWHHVKSPADAMQFGFSIDTQARKVVSFGTATGSALRYAGQLFEDNGFAGARRVIDVTSDERSNQGPHPRGVRDAVLAKGITINGLAILDDYFDMEGYFRDNVTGGPGSFILSVNTYADFAWAIRLKLIREISNKPYAGRFPRPTDIALNHIP